MSLERKILFGFIGCAVVMTAVAFYSFKNSAKLVDTNEWVNHTHEVLAEFEQILAATVDAETGMRGYLLAGNESFLEPYNDARARTLQHLNAVSDLTSDNPTQQRNLERLRKSIEDIFKFRADMVSLYKTNQTEAL